MNEDLLKRKCEKARVKLGLSPEHVRMLQNCAWGLYEEVSYDLEPSNKKRRSCSRAIVLEVVTDAGRLEQEIRRRLDIPFPKRGDVNDFGETYPIVQACRDYDLIRDLIGPAFSASEYECGRDI